MGKRLYVGNLPYDQCTDAALRMLFSPLKINDTKVVLDRETRRPRGFCFVEFDDASDAAAAVVQYNGTEFGGRRIVVNLARERERGGYPGGRR